MSVYFRFDDYEVGDIFFADDDIPFHLHKDGGNEGYIPQGSPVMTFMATTSTVGKVISVICSLGVGWIHSGWFPPEKNA